MIPKNDFEKLDKEIHLLFEQATLDANEMAMMYELYQLWKEEQKALANTNQENGSDAQ